MGAVLRHANIWNELISGISKPHGFDVSSYYVSRFVSLGEVIVLNRCGHSIRKRLNKDSKESRILTI